MCINSHQIDQNKLDEERNRRSVDSKKNCETEEKLQRNKWRPARTWIKKKKRRKNKIII